MATERVNAAGEVVNRPRQRTRETRTEYRRRVQFWINTTTERPKQPKEPKTSKLAPILSKLTEEERRLMVEEIMKYPAGCDDGKRKFIGKLGLPVPPRTVEVRVYLTTQERPGDINATGTLSTRGRERVHTLLKAALKDTEFKVSSEMRLTGRASHGARR